MTKNKNFLKSIENVRKLGFKEPTETQFRTNPFTGKTHPLKPLAVMLYDFITNHHLTCDKDYTRQDWDNCRYAFNEMWPDEYYDLLD
jgi:hypothetical protein